MAEPKGLSGMKWMDAVKLVNEARAVQQRIEEGVASDAERAEYTQRYEPILKEFKKMIAPTAPQLLALVDGMADGVVTMGAEAAVFIKRQRDQAKQLYKSGKYYTMLETDREYILIIDGKEKNRYPCTEKLDTWKRLEEIQRIESKINKLAAVQKRSRLDATFYELFVENENKKIREVTPSSALMQFLKDLLTHGVNLTGTKDKKIKIEHDQIINQYIISYESRSAKGTIYIPNLDKITSANGKDITARKVMLFLLVKANEQGFSDTVNFDIRDLVERGIYGNEKTAFSGLKNILDNFLSIQIEGVTKNGKSTIRRQKSVLFTQYDITRRACVVNCNGNIFSFLSQFFMLVPTWIYRLNKKGFLLGDYIYYMARQEQGYDNIAVNGKFQISFRAINQALGNPKPKETQRHTQFIINPILNAIDEVERESEKAGRKLKLTPIYNHDYKNGYDFLENGYLEVELYEEETDYAKNISKLAITETEKAIKRAEKIRLAAINRKQKAP